MEQQWSNNGAVLEHCWSMLKCSGPDCDRASYRGYHRSVGWTYCKKDLEYNSWYVSPSIHSPHSPKILSGIEMDLGLACPRIASMGPDRLKNPDACPSTLLHDYHSSVLPIFTCVQRTHVHIPYHLHLKPGHLPVKARLIRTDPKHRL